MSHRHRFLADLPPVIGHRGAARHAPENTLPGLRMAARLGCAMVEVDVRLSRDGVPFLLHDETLERTTDGTGEAKDRDWADLQTLDAGAWFDAAFAGTRLPSLEQALQVCLDLDLAVNIEIKPDAGRVQETAEVVVETATRLWPTDRTAPMFSSFRPLALLAARRLQPEWPRGYLIRDRRPDWDVTAGSIDPTTFNIHEKDADPATIAAYRALNAPVLVYTVNDPARAAEVYRAGAAAIFSDAPDRLHPVADAILGARDRAPDAD